MQLQSGMPVAAELHAVGGGWAARSGQVMLQLDQNGFATGPILHSGDDATKGPACAQEVNGVFTTS